MKQKVYHLFKNHLCGIIIWIALILGITSTICISLEDYQSHISCIVGIISLLFSAWVAYQAITIRQHVLNKSALKIIDDLYNEWKPPLGDAIEVLSEKKRNEAIQAYDYVLNTARYLPQEIADPISIAKTQLEQDKKNQNQTSTKTFTRQLASIWETSHNL